MLPRRKKAPKEMEAVGEFAEGVRACGDSPESALDLNRLTTGLVWVDADLRIRYCNALARNLLAWAEGHRGESPLRLERAVGAERSPFTPEESTQLRRFLGAPSATARSRRVSLFGRNLEVSWHSEFGPRGEWRGWLLEVRPAAAAQAAAFDELPFHAVGIDAAGAIRAATARWFQWYEELAEWKPAPSSQVLLASAGSILGAPSSVASPAMWEQRIGPHRMAWISLPVPEGHPWGFPAIAIGAPGAVRQAREASPSGDALFAGLEAHAWSLVREADRALEFEPAH
ncbi:MAG: hypothetical protein JNJ88_19665 [Planctomycetes bacterium]|nr:hypothetical protein [Planctomycetota bacterium]